LTLMIFSTNSFGLMFYNASRALNIDSMKYIGWTFMFLGGFLFGLISIVLLAHYILKKTFFRDLQDPKVGYFIVGFTISILQFSLMATQFSEITAEVLWCIGCIAQIVLTSYFVDKLASNQIDVISPPLFLACVAIVFIGFPVSQFSVSIFIEIGWIFFGGGLILYVVLLLLTIVHSANSQNFIPDEKLPSLCIYYCPPALLIIGYYNLTHTFDFFFRMMYALCVLTAGVVFRLSFSRKVVIPPFTISYWSYVFPTSALAIATIYYYENVPNLILLTWTWCLIGTTSLFWILAFVGTIKISVAQFCCK